MQNGFLAFTKGIELLKKYIYRNEVYEKAITLIYPRRCSVCDKVLPYGYLIHDECKRKLDYTTNYNRCFKCGKILVNSESEYCADCLSTSHMFDMAISLYPYRNVSASIYKFKYGSRQEYAFFWAKEIRNKLGIYIEAMNADMIIPVPMYEKKKIKRGYNQAECLAKMISLEFGISYRPDIVKRIRDTTPMKELSKSSRHLNLKKAFIVVKNDVKLKKIIIVDDIYTTGTTVDHISYVLRRFGAQNVYVLTLAIGQST